MSKSKRNYEDAFKNIRKLLSNQPEAQKSLTIIDHFVGELRSEIKDLDSFLFESTRTFARLANGNPYVLFPANYCTPTKVRIVLAVNNHHLLVPTGQLLHVQEGTTWNSVLQMLIERSRLYFGIEVGQYWGIIRSTFAARSLIKGEPAQSAIQAAEAIPSDVPIQEVIDGILQETDDLFGGESDEATLFGKGTASDS